MPPTAESAPLVAEPRSQDAIEMPWTAEDSGALVAAASALQQALPALARSAVAAGQLTYTGPAFGTETEQIRGLLAELRRRGVTITFDPTELEGYEESDRAGDGWQLQFKVPGDPRT